MFLWNITPLPLSPPQRHLKSEDQGKDPKVVGNDVIWAKLDPRIPNMSTIPCICQNGQVKLVCKQIYRMTDRKTGLKAYAPNKHLIQGHTNMKKLPSLEILWFIANPLLVTNFVGFSLAHKIWHFDLQVFHFDSRFVKLAILFLLTRPSFRKSYPRTSIMVSGTYKNVYRFGYGWYANLKYEMTWGTTCIFLAMPIFSETVNIRFPLEPSPCESLAEVEGRLMCPTLRLLLPLPLSSLSDSTRLITVGELLSRLYFCSFCLPLLLQIKLISSYTVFSCISI